MLNAELEELVRLNRQYRGKAIFELVDRAPSDGDAAARLATLSRLPVTRDDRLHLVSLAWAAIIGLLATENTSTRRLAYDAFHDLDVTDRESLLRYLGCERIEDAHPPHPV